MGDAAGNYGNDREIWAPPDQSDEYIDASISEMIPL